MRARLYNTPPPDEPHQNHRLRVLRATMSIMNLWTDIYSLDAEIPSLEFGGPTPYDVTSMSERASFLGVPPELRLQIYDYMSLWPSAEEREDWSGIYNSCRKIQDEMRLHVSLEKDIVRNLDRLRAQKATIHHPFDIDPSFSASSSSLLRGLIIAIPFHLMHEFPSQLLQSVYELYLEYVTITLVTKGSTMATSPGSTSLLLPYGDLKSLAPQAFESHVKNGRMNCKKVTISIPHLAYLTRGPAEGKSTDLEMKIICGDQRIPYTLTIVQNSMEYQMSKTFFSPTRFRPAPEDTPDDQEFPPVSRRRDHCGVQ